MTVPALAGAGQAVALAATTRNQGGGHAASTLTRFYLSANALPDGADTVLASVTVPALPPGASTAASVTATLPAPLGTGTYYIVALADAEALEAEPSETNNDYARSIRIGPDLTMAAMTVPATAAPGGSLVVSDTVRNQGGGEAGATVTRFYLSTNSTFDASDVLLTGSRTVPALAADQTSSGSTTLQVPASTTTGSYYVIARIDADGSLPETSETNNSAARGLKVGADLVVSLVAPAIGGAGAALTVTDTVANQGAGASTSSTTRFYLSVNSTIGEGDVLLAASRAVPALSAGATSSAATTLTLPEPLATGSYYVVARADADDGVVETSESNNTAARAVSVGPDLRAVTLTVPYQQRAGVASTISLTVENRGGGGAPAALTRFYLSNDTKYDAADVALDATTTVPALAAGTQIVVSLAITLPAGTPPGIYYVFARVDADGLLAETQENNNAVWKTVNVSAP
jgi:subtilase family serine protease